MLPKPIIMSTNVWCKPSFILFLTLLWVALASAQKDTTGFWEAPDSFHKGRFWTAAGTGMVVYTGAVLSLNHLWYTDYPRTSFHSFNDWEEWQQMDKAGHMFTAYFESDWAYHVARWTGMKKKSSIWTGALVAIGLQATIEILDGFSSEWGFSPYDMAFNVAGAGFWAGQQAVWNEQRIRMKVSTTYRKYPDERIMGIPGGETTIRERTDDLYGSTFLETFLKDYNAQTIWLSVNIHSFMKTESKFPKWLNIAAGYGAENMFGGFENKWEMDGNTFATNNEKYPRYRQFVLSPDIDLSKLNIKSKPLKTIVYILNIFKIPAPAIVLNGKGGVEWDWLYY